MQISTALRRRLVAVVAALVAAGAGLMPALALAPAWSVQAHPQPTARQGSLFGVSCPSTTYCTAVGRADDKTGKQVSLAEGWNGTAWSIQATPNPTGATSTFLVGVSCTSSTACTAVGGTAKSPTLRTTLAERWNGTAWSIQSTPSPTGATASALGGVSCTSSTGCEAVGTAVTSGVAATLAEVWNGTAWTAQTIPSPAGASSSMSDVSCTSATACMAVGFSSPSSTSTVTLAEAWNGTGWSVVPTPNPTGATRSFLIDVSCTSASICTAVGAGVGSTSTASLAERWNGSVWTIEATPNPTGANATYLEGVSCTSSMACSATGVTASTTGAAPVAEGWNGTSWTLQSVASPPGATSSFLGRVSCTSSSRCTSVGVAVHVNPTVPVTLAEAWNGTAWAAQSTPNPSGAVSNNLAGVSCATSSACTGVGTRGARSPLAEIWNGTSWAIQSVPGPTGALVSSLGGVSCVSPTACTAVGSARLTSSVVTLAEAWNGTAWSIHSTPNPSGALFSQLSGVSCASSTACIAVGVSQSTGQPSPLAEAWNGSAWTLQSVPLPSGSTGAYFSGVSCTSASACTAVGVAFTSTAKVTLAEVWNGSSWTVQTTPNPTGATASYLFGVSCTSTTFCTAVGINSSTTGSTPIAEGWNGSTWSLETVPAPAGATGTSLDGVSCTSASACEAVGSSSASKGFPSMLAEGWNGTSWTIQVTPGPANALFTALSGVSCTASTTCTAVGAFAYGGGPNLSLVERYM
jgi:hypothetical protein